MSSDRDFLGYGGRMPKNVWPKEAQIAINFVLNYEEGSERNILDGDDQSETRRFLSCFIQKSHAACGFIEKGEMQGYGIIRPCYKGYKIGPLFATSPTVAKTLFETLCAAVSQGPIYWDVPEPNQNSLNLAKHYQMNPCFETIRMYRNGFPSLDLTGVYGITTFELG